MKVDYNKMPIKDLAELIWNLEKKCTTSNKYLDEMEEIYDSLSFPRAAAVTFYIEENFS